jgi:poly(A) polymerase
VVPERLRLVIDQTRSLADAFSSAGFRLYLVGGVVRDMFVSVEHLTGSTHDDIDLTTDATPDQILSVVRPLAQELWEQGKRFGTIGCTIDGNRCEITTHRAEAYAPDSRKPEVEFSDKVEDDLSRRDFTVNAMALEITAAEPQLIDPFGGLADLAERRLRTPVEPERSFSDDPLRMMRAARFISRFDLEPDPALVAAVNEMAGRMEIVSAERVRDELCKLMVVPDPSKGLWFLHDTGLSDTFLPELAGLRLEQDPIHRHKDVLTHSIAVVAKAPPRQRVRLAALFHDVGKPRTRAIGDNGVSFHHHEVVGARMTRDRMKALKFSNDMTAEVTELVYLHLRFHTFEMGWTDAAVRRFVRDAGPLLDDLMDLTRSDCTTRNKKKAERLERNLDVLAARIAELQEKEELASIRPDLDGAAVMAHLGIPPGRVVGDALAHLLELRLEHGPLEHDAALAELDSWWAAREGGTIGIEQSAGN